MFFIFIGNVVDYSILITGVVFRLKHSGRVCSGDFMKLDDKTDGYLMLQGQLLFGVFCFFTAVLIGAILAWFVIAMLMYIK